jgi:hypothetical protein
MDMAIRRILTTAALAAAFAAGSAGTATATVPHQAQRLPATFVAHETGYGSTLIAAEQSARNMFANDFYGCGTAFLVSDGQLANGTWWAYMAANCSGYR